MTVNYQAPVDEPLLTRPFSAHCKGKSVPIRHNFDTILPAPPSIRHISEIQNAQLKSLNQIPVNTGSSLKDETMFWNFESQAVFNFNGNVGPHRKNKYSNSKQLSEKFEDCDPCGRIKKEKQNEPPKPKDGFKSPSTDPCCPDGNSENQNKKTSNSSDPCSSNNTKKHKEKPCKICIPEWNETVVMKREYKVPIVHNLKHKSSFVSNTNQEYHKNQTKQKNNVEFKLPTNSQIDVDGSSYLIHELNKIKYDITQLQNESTGKNIDIKDAVQIMHIVKSKINSAFKTNSGLESMKNEIKNKKSAPPKLITHQTGRFSIHNQATSPIESQRKNLKPSIWNVNSPIYDNGVYYDGGNVRSKTVLTRKIERPKQYMPPHKNAGISSLRKVMNGSRMSLNTPLLK